MNNDGKNLRVKFKSLKSIIKNWNFQQGNVRDNISSLEKEINELDKCQLPTLQQFSDKLQIEQKLQEAYSTWDGILKQKSRLSWEVQCDTNTKFFHNYVKFRLTKKSYSWCHMGRQVGNEIRGHQRCLLQLLLQFYQEIRPSKGFLIRKFGQQETNNTASSFT